MFLWDYPKSVLLVPLAYINPVQLYAFPFLFFPNAISKNPICFLGFLGFLKFNFAIWGFLRKLGIIFLHEATGSPRKPRTPTTRH